MPEKGDYSYNAAEARGNLVPFTTDPDPEHTYLCELLSPFADKHRKSTVIINRLHLMLMIGYLSPVAAPSSLPVVHEQGQCRALIRLVSGNAQGDERRGVLACV